MKTLSNKERNNQEVAVKIEGLCKDYKMFARKKDRLLETLFPFMERHGVFHAMQDFNLEVRKGEVLGVLGKKWSRKINTIKNDNRSCNTNSRKNNFKWKSKLTF